MSQPTTSAIDELLQEGVLRKRQGDYEGAKLIYRRAIELAPDVFTCYSSMAKVCYLMGKRQEAASNYLRSMHLSIVFASGLAAGSAYENQRIEAYLTRRDRNEVETLRQLVNRSAPYLLLDQNTLYHVAHALLDLDPSNKPPAVVAVYIQRYCESLAGKGIKLDEAFEMMVYRPVGPQFFMQNICWERIKQKDVRTIYPDQFRFIEP